MHQLGTQGNGSLSLHLLVSFVLTFWSSATGSKSVLSAVNVAYDETEQRPFPHLQVIGVSMAEKAGSTELNDAPIWVV